MVRRLAVILMVTVAVGCTSQNDDDDDNDNDVTVAADAGEPEADAGTELPDAGQQDPPDAGGPLTLRIFHTSDEHGWIVPERVDNKVVGGAANVQAWWKDLERFDPTKDLVLSGGDCWTGPAISGWFQGESTVEVMNQMGYTAQALGNHEFDFGLDALRARAQQANHVFLSANIHSNTVNLDFIQPYIITELQGVKIGIIGLTTVTTLQATNVINIGGLEFDDLDTTLERVVPDVQAAGAEVIVILAHESFAEMAALANSLRVYMDVVFAAHGHEVDYVLKRGIPVIANGTQFQNYSVTTLTFDPVIRYVTSTATEQWTVEYPASGHNPVTPDPAVTAIVDSWQQRTDEQLAEEIGYTATGLPAPSWIMGNWVMDAWRWANPDADLAMTNFGTFRQNLDRGAITLEDIVSLMPFRDAILEVQLTGQQVLDNLATVTAGGQFDTCWPAVSGMTWTGTGTSVAVQLSGGQAIDRAATYRVLISDYVYVGGCGYRFQSQDPTPLAMGMDEREPAINWTREQHTTSADPLERHLDGNARGPTN